MANLKEIRNRIASVSSTQQITSAMKMVSAAKLRRAQEAILQMRPYAEQLHMILTYLSDAIKDEEDDPYGVERELEKILVVVVTSNRGLCGGFNSAVIKQALQLVNEEYGTLMRKNNVDFHAIGKRAAEFFRKNHFQLVGENSELFDKLSFENVMPVAENIMSDYTMRKYDRVLLVYNQFKNAAVQVLTVEQFLPVVHPEHTEESSIITDYIFEPSKEYIVKELIPKTLKMQFYKALLDSHAAEHGARMTAMHKATDNATEIIKDLRLTYNKARQATITNEILEIVSGAEALKKS
ncbi:ATP synthase F1 subunit gamma [Bacteroidota bacterium]